LSKFQPRARSAARDKLQETIDARAEMDSTLAALTASISKLDAQAAEVAPLETALARLDEADDYAALRWARGESADRPVPDVDARAKLVAALNAARLSAASAARAKDVISAQMKAESAKAPNIQRFADAAIVEILCETAAPLVDELRAAGIALAAKIKSLEAVSGMALALAEKGRHVPGVSAVDHELAALGVKGLALQNPEPVNPTPPEALRAATALLEKFSMGLWAPVANGIAAAAEAFPAILEKHIAATSAWRTFAEELRVDAGVHFAAVKR
jgi:hypothetical protein